MVKKEILGKLGRFKRLLEEEGVPVEKLLLFGSHARGTAHRDSDIDVCVVSGSFGRNRFRERRLLARQAPRIDARIEPVPFSPEEFRKNLVSPLLHQIRKEAIEINGQADAVFRRPGAPAKRRRRILRRLRGPRRQGGRP